jgi:hypothetical protein
VQSSLTFFQRIDLAEGSGQGEHPSHLAVTMPFGVPGWILTLALSHDRLKSTLLYIFFGH